MSTDNFLDSRNKFAAEIGIPNLYDVIDHFGLYAGVHTIGNKLFTYEMMKTTVGIPGDIAEFGCWNGANLMYLAKLAALLQPHSPKRVFGFNNFEGLPEPSPEDGDYASTQTGSYLGNLDTLTKAISLFHMEEKVVLVKGDALETIPKFYSINTEMFLSFAYLDFDLYEPTKAALSLIEDCISVGGVIVFDEACTPEWPGETFAMKQYLQTTRHNFEMIGNHFSRQPTVALRRTK